MRHSQTAPVGVEGSRHLSNWELAYTHFERPSATFHGDGTMGITPTLLQQQARFDVFLASYNQERPHQGLGMRARRALHAVRATAHRRPSQKPAEPLFAFVRVSDGRPINCELMFNGESYGWEARFLDGDELWYSRGGFALKELAVAWAWEARRAMEG
jgi:hypothetical protein